MESIINKINKFKNKYDNKMVFDVINNEIKYYYNEEQTIDELKNEIKTIIKDFKYEVKHCLNCDVLYYKFFSVKLSDGKIIGLSCYFCQVINFIKYSNDNKIIFRIERESKKTSEIEFDKIKKETIIKILNNQNYFN